MHTLWQDVKYCSLLIAKDAATQRSFAMTRQLMVERSFLCTVAGGGLGLLLGSGLMNIFTLAIVSEEGRRD